MRFGKLTFSVRCDLCSEGDGCANKRSRVVVRAFLNITLKVKQRRGMSKTRCCVEVCAIIYFWSTPKINSLLRQLPLVIDVVFDVSLQVCTHMHT